MQRGIRCNINEPLFSFTSKRLQKGDRENKQTNSFSLFFFFSLLSSRSFSISPLFLSLGFHDFEDKI